MFKAQPAEEVTNPDAAKETKSNASHVVKIEGAEGPSVKDITQDGAAAPAKLVSMLKYSPKQVILLVVPIVIYPPAGGVGIHTFAFLDNGSEGSLLREDMALKVGVRGKPGILDLTTIKDDPEEVPVTDIKGLVVSSQDNTYQRTIDEVSVVSAERFNFPGRKRIADLVDPDLHSHLHGINIDPIHPNT